MSNEGGAFQYELKMDESVAEIVMTALIFYAESLKEEVFKDFEKEEIDLVVDKAMATAAAISGSLNQDEARH